MENALSDRIYAVLEYPLSLNEIVGKLGCSVHDAKVTLGRLMIARRVRFAKFPLIAADGSGRVGTFERVE